MRQNSTVLHLFLRSVSFRFVSFRFTHIVDYLSNYWVCARTLTAFTFCVWNCQHQFYEQWEFSICDAFDTWHSIRCCFCCLFVKAFWRIFRLFSSPIPSCMCVMNSFPSILRWHLFSSLFFFHFVTHIHTDVCVCSLCACYSAARHQCHIE